MNGGPPRCIEARVPCRGCHGPVRKGGNQLMDILNALASNGIDTKNLPDRLLSLRFSRSPRQTELALLAQSLIEEFPVLTGFGRLGSTGKGFLCAGQRRNAMCASAREITIEPVTRIEGHAQDRYHA